MCKAKWVMASLAALTLAVTANAKELQQAAEGKFVAPISVAPVQMNADGTLTYTGDWVPYTGQADHDYPGATLWDAFEHNPTTGFPTDIGTTDCEIGGSRWFFGTTYCNMFAVSDMDPEGGDSTAQAVNFGWYHACLIGPGQAEPLVAIVLGGESFDPSCTGYSLGAGVALNFGDLNCNSGFYFFTLVDLSGAPFGVPVFANGSYSVIFTKDGTLDNLSSCDQPMLWGTDIGEGRHANTDNGPVQYDDDNPSDGQHVGECYDYTFGVCPDPLTAMMSFGGEGAPPCDPELCGGTEALRAPRLRQRCRGFGSKKLVVKQTVRNVVQDQFAFGELYQDGNLVSSDNGRSRDTNNFTVRLKHVSLQCDTYEPGLVEHRISFWGDRDQTIEGCGCGDTVLSEEINVPSDCDCPA